MSALWILSPLLGVVAFFGILFGSLFLGGTLGRTSGTSIGLFGGAIAGFIAGIIIAIILFVLPWYRLIRRRNGHFRRDRMLREGLINYVRGLAAVGGVDLKMAIDLSAVTGINTDANRE